MLVCEILKYNLCRVQIHSLLFVISQNKLIFFSTDLTFKRLVIGVISARDHLSHRNAIRQTWGSLVQDLPHVELVFVLGDRDCPLHPADRLSSRTCREWYIGEDIENSHVRTFFKSKNELAKVTLDSECSTGLGIKILHPVILEEVSVRATVLKNAADIFIILQDAKEMIESVKVSSESCSEENGYCSIKLPAPLYLPKGFEGELRVHKKGIDDISLCGEDLYSLQSKTKWVCYFYFLFFFLFLGR
nr:UDP-GalNAc:beta-1,3-N-acetylgalactosaminyltransferase 2-like [Cherax quadricarinatus]